MININGIFEYYLVVNIFSNFEIFLDQTKLFNNFLKSSLFINFSLSSQSTCYAIEIEIK